MEKIGALTILFFLIITFLYWKMSKAYFKNEIFSKGTWKNWRTRLYYWQGAIFVSSGITILAIFLLKWTNVLNL